MNLGQFILAIYRMCLQFYPRSYRVEYAQELEFFMQHSVKEAAARGNLALMQLAGRELRDLPGAILREHLNESWRRKMNAAGGRSFLEEPIEGRWKWLALFCPFLLVSLVVMLNYFYRVIRIPFWASNLMLICALLCALVVVIIGMKQGMPNWAFPMLGLVISILGFSLFSTYGQSLNFPRRPGIMNRVLGRAFFVFEIYSPNFILAVLTLVIATLIPTLKRMAVNVRHDWSWLSLLIYCSTMIQPLLGFEEYIDDGLFQILWLVLLGLGVWIFLQLSKPGWRLLVLLAVIMLTTVLNSLGVYIIYPHQIWYLTTTFPRWWSAVVPAIDGVVLLVLVALPVLLRLFPNKLSKTNKEISVIG